MDATTYYLELMFIFVNMIQLQKLMKRTMLGESLFLEKKRQEVLEKHLALNSLELIQAIVIKIMKLVGYKHL